ncbi:PAS domain S-box-containing protein [Variovorax sp. W1I1]|uniref:PAS domain-containing protein n=1 Tax=Variovorax sp. W1I1 TaxID=3042309 RepID=UPI00278064B1|nr:PAS domain-containing protein [Variovorax sp. W1I1]MDQ0608135.1 PAS domain S-box-containing protein [Variovorax sp. W1I1]
MPDHLVKATPRGDLRLRAASRLERTGGAAGAKSSAAKATDALAVLHALASSPDTAADALALLHELQVHQVELDLQAEELRESRAELEVALRRQVELYDFHPVGCFSLDRTLLIREANLRGARMLGIEHDEARGLPIDTFFTTDSLRALQHLIAKTGRGGYASGTLRWRDANGLEPAVRVEVSPAPSGDGCFVALMNIEDI